MSKEILMRMADTEGRVLTFNIKNGLCIIGDNKSNLNRIILIIKKSMRQCIIWSLSHRVII